MAKRRQFVLDDQTNALLEGLAADGVGNLSHVVREAIQLYAQMEARLDEVEQDPAFQQMVERAAEDIRLGRVVSQDQAQKRVRSRRRRG